VLLVEAVVVVAAAAVVLAGRVGLVATVEWVQELLSLRQRP
jgi:hypothetical protein